MSSFKNCTSCEKSNEWKKESWWTLRVNDQSSKNSGNKRNQWHDIGSAVQRKEWSPTARAEIGSGTRSDARIRPSLELSFLLLKAIFRGVFLLKSSGETLLQWGAGKDNREMRVPKPPHRPLGSRLSVWILEQMSNAEQCLKPSQGGDAICDSPLSEARTTHPETPCSKYPPWPSACGPGSPSGLSLPWGVAIALALISVPGGGLCSECIPVLFTA